MVTTNGRLTTPSLHRRFLDEISPSVVNFGSIEQKPLEVDLKPPLPTKIRVYLYNATAPPGGRKPGEGKINLIVPGQTKGDQGNFDHSGGRIALLVGYHKPHDVFILWDANLHIDFSYSKNLQVNPDTLYSAAAGRLATQERHLRSVGKTEVVVAVHAQDLEKGIGRRVDITRSQMSS